ncbi:MAG: transglycosylase SLT domain-containing protein [Dokdonella sp.]
MVLNVRLVMLTAVSMLVSALLAGCAAAPTTGGKPSVAGKSGDPGVDALYTRLDVDGRRYEDALALARTGDVAKAGSEMKAALDDMRTTTIGCAKVPGCDNQRFYSALDRLIRLTSVGTGIGSSPDVVEAGEDAGDEGGVSEAGETSPIVTSLPEMRRSITLLKGRELSDVIAVNDAVKAGIEQWLTQLRPNLMTAYVNYEYLRSRMWPEYHKAGLPEAVLFGILAKESGGKVHAVSRAGASGPLQFMYATGVRFGLGSVDGFDQRFDPTMAARANAAYLDEQLAAMNNNLEFALAAYNGGEGRMQRLAAAQPGASFWDPPMYSAVPEETRDYVPMVLAAAWLFLHPDRYNLRFPKINDTPTTVVLKKPASIAELTVCLGQAGGNSDGWFRTLRNLNPRLDHAAVQPAGTRIDLPASLADDYSRSCAAGRWQTLASDLHSAVPPPRPIAVATAPVSSGKARRSSQSRSYVVRKGDTLSSIARKTSCANSQDIAERNNLRRPHYPIRIGQALSLPTCSAH